MKHIVKINGPIISSDEKWIYDLFEMEHTSPACVDEQLEGAENKDIVVQINSGGGSVFAGSEIYTKLKALDADVEIVGIAGSAASFIAMAGNKVSISPTAQIMIHNASTISAGDKKEMEQTGTFLSSIDSSIAYAYELKTGLSEAELLDMMDKETWLNAKMAVEKGFADAIMFEKIDAVANIGSTLPKNAIDKIRNVMATPKDFESRLSSIESKLEALTQKNKKEEKPTKNSWLF